MRTLTIYTDPIKPGICQIPPFVLGDDTSWKLLFNDGTGLYLPSNVSMRVGHVNGLAAGSYANSFEWIDRMNNRHIASFAISAGCSPAGGTPGTLTWDEDPLHVDGGNGAWLLRGRTPPGSQIRKVNLIEKGGHYASAPAVSFFGGLGALTTYDTQRPSAVAFVEVVTIGSGYSSGTGPVAAGKTITTVAFTGGGGGGAAAIAIVNSGRVVDIQLVSGGQGYSTPPTVTIYGDGVGATAACTLVGATNILLNTVKPAAATANLDGSGYLSSITLNDGGAGYTSLPSVVFGPNSGGSQAEACGIETNAEPFLRNPSSVAMTRAVSAVPWWRGRRTLSNVPVYDDSLLIIRPTLVANAVLTEGASYWSGTLNPVNDYVNAVLAFRRTCVMDLQIFGDGRLLYQGAFAVMSTLQTS